MSPSMNSILPAIPARFSVFPVERSSRTRTESPRPTKVSAMCEPMKPAPPVTRYFAITVVPKTLIILN